MQTVVEYQAMNDNKTSPSVVIVPTTRIHVLELRDNLREKDRREIEGLGISPSKSLWHNYKHGLMNQTALIDGRVAAMWGVGGTYMSDTGMIWLLTSDAVWKISPLQFARIYQREVYRFLQMFKRLENYVDSSYAEAIRLLSIVGFTVEGEQPLGNGMYRKFWIERKD